MLNKEEFYVTVPNSYYNNLDISNEELVTYCLLKRNYSKSKSVSVVSINYVLDLLNVRRDSYVKEIKGYIDSLLDKELILGLYDINYNPITVEDITNKNFMFLVEFDDLDVEYFMVKDTSLDSIFSYLHNTNMDKFAFARYFIAIARVVNNPSNFGYLTQSSVKNICGKSATIRKYNTILMEELKLIRFNNSYMTPELHNCSTYFGMYDDVENFNSKMEDTIKEKNLVLFNKENTNKKRSTTQKIKNLENKINKENKDKEIAELKAEIKRLKEEKKTLNRSKKKNSSNASDNVLEVFKKPKGLNKKDVFDLGEFEFEDDDDSVNF